MPYKIYYREGENVSTKLDLAATNLETGAVGNSETPVYFNENGQPVACSNVATTHLLEGVKKINIVYSADKVTLSITFSDITLEGK